MIKDLKRFKRESLIHPPKWLIDNTIYLCAMGSVAYGVSTNVSDIDVYGFCMPPVGLVFPHTQGLVHGFDEVKGFEQWQEHHVKDTSNSNEYDFSIYSIIKYFYLVKSNNPNMIDSLFVPRNCVLHSTQMSEHIRENRLLFLHKGSWHKFKGYAYSSLNKMKGKSPMVGSKRAESVAKYGYDVKFAYHTVRLLNEVEQIMVEHNLDLQKNREQLKSIRRGDWTMDEVVNYASNKEKDLEKVYLESSLRHSPDDIAIKQLLLDCLEMHYGSLDKMIKVSGSKDSKILDLIRDLVN